MMLGQIDYHLVKPWFPDQGLYPAVSEFLASWARSEPTGFTLFRIAAPENSARAYEIRDLLTRFNTPFTFHSTDSEEGAALLRGGRAARLPAPDGRPTRRSRARRPDGRRPHRSRRRRDAPRCGRLRRRDRRRRACRPGSGRLCGLGRTRHDRPRAPDLGRSGRLELSHPQRPRVHLGDRWPRPLVSRVRAGVAVRGEPGLRAGGDVASRLGCGAHRADGRWSGVGRSHRRARHGRFVAAPRDPAAGRADRRGRLLRRSNERGARNARKARVRRRRRQRRGAGSRASGEVRRRGHAARARRLAREEHVGVPDRRAA